MSSGSKKGRRGPGTSWDPLASWYDGWVGREGSHFHRKIAVPAVLDLLRPQKGERILDIGAGQGVLAPGILARQAEYTGVDASARLIAMARKHHPTVRFIVGDARYLAAIRELSPESFDAAVFLLSIQDMEPLDQVLDSAAWALREGGRLIVLMTHPAFRVPRQSGWGWDSKRKLRYRRIDRYLTTLKVPMKAYPGKGGGVSHSYHRSLSTYVDGLAEAGFVIERIRELPTYKKVRSARAKAENMANQEFPLFLALRAFKIAVVLPG